VTTALGCQEPTWSANAPDSLFDWELNPSCSASDMRTDQPDDPSSDLLKTRSWMALLGLPPSEVRPFCRRFCRDGLLELSFRCLQMSLKSLSTTIWMTSCPSMNPSKQPTAQEKLSATYWLLPVTRQYGMCRLLINRSPLPSPQLDP
jgi:hypothetical protein